jgi:prepilin-type N-terminal cleavage/methylation domain-containing protein
MPGEGTGMKLSKPKGRPKGYTLIEFIISIVILGILGAFTFSFLGSGLSLYVEQQQHKTLYDEGRLALKYMAREIRDANRNAAITIGASSITFTRQHPFPITITYNLSGNTLNRVSNGTYPLAGNVSAFNPAYNSLTNLVTFEIVLTQAGGGAVRFSTEIYPRNYV